MGNYCGPLPASKASALITVRYWLKEAMATWARLLWPALLVPIGLITLVLGAVEAFFDPDLKGMLAKTTVATLGLITMLYGLGLNGHAAGFNPYTMVRAGTWTYANFAKISKELTKDTNGDGKPDILGSYTSSMNQNRVFLFTNNSKILNFVGGKYKYVGDSANTVEAIDFLNTLINVDKCHMTKYDNIPNYAGYEDSFSQDSFGQAKIAMMMPPWTHLSKTDVFESYLANAKFDWGIVPLPKGPKNTTKIYKSMITDPRVYFILTNNSIANVKKSAVVINALARRLNNDTWEAEMKARLRDSESLEMIKSYIFPGLFMDIFMATEAARKWGGYNGFIAGVCEDILSREKTAQAGMSSIKSVFQAYVDSVINNKLA
jgi:hypothetical protein